MLLGQRGVLGCLGVLALWDDSRQVLLQVACVGCSALLYSLVDGNQAQPLLIIEQIAAQQQHFLAGCIVLLSGQECSAQADRRMVVARRRRICCLRCGTVECTLVALERVWCGRQGGS